MSCEDTKKLKVGILGGTFDPIHNAHLGMAACALSQLGLSEVRFVPAGSPPHKQERPDGASDADRLEMVRLAVASDPAFVLDPEEMQRAGKSYSYQTLEALHEREPDKAFYFIIGADSLMDFDSWRHPERICRYCSLAVAGRDRLDDERLARKAGELKDRFGARIVLLDFPQMAISSRYLRRLRREGRSIRAYVPDAVADYIEKKQLYLTKRQLWEQA